MRKIICILLLIIFCDLNYAQQIGPNLKFLSVNNNSENTTLLKLPAQNIIPATLQFTEPINISKIEESLPDGISLFKIDGQPLLSTHVVIVNIDLNKLSEMDLFQIPSLIQVETLWSPHHVPPLNVSRPQIQADQLWEKIDNNGIHTTGKGI